MANKYFRLKKEKIILDIISLKY